MTIPRATELQPGVQVNIILKADQLSGKLTRGQVSDILTRGNHHPRGIKVRLQDGQVGRVQSLLAAVGSGGVRDEPAAAMIIPSSARDGDSGADTGPAAAAAAAAASASTSLLDYVKLPKQQKKTKRERAQQEQQQQQQQLLEVEFPGLDSALIAAILSDHDSDLVLARATLSSLF